MGILKQQLDGVKVLGNGELTKKITVKENECKWRIWTHFKKGNW